MSAMSSMLLAMGALVLLLASNASAHDQIPSWIEEEVEQVAPLLSGILKLPRDPFIKLHVDEDAEIKGLRVIEGEATSEQISITLSGDWSERTPEARRQLVRNLSHELAHVWQYTRGMPNEPRLLHEGFAESISMEALATCGASCGGNPRGLKLELEAACGRALREGPIDSLKSRDAIYGCGAILTASAAARAKISAQQLYQTFAEKARTTDAFFEAVAELGGQSARISARAFLSRDYRLAKPSDVIERLRAGRL